MHLREFTNTFSFGTFWTLACDVFTKGLASSRKCFVENEVFWSLKDFWRMKKDLFFFFVTISLFFWKTFPSHLQLILSTEKKCIHNSMLLWKKDVKMTVKEYKIISSKVKSYFRTLFWPFLGKRRNFEKYILCLVWWMKLVETLSLLINTKLKQISNAQKKN